MTAPTSLSRTPPEEPVLDMMDIQGIVTPGFFKPSETLLGLQIPDGPEVIFNFKRFLRALLDDVSTARTTLDDRRNFRDRKHMTHERHPVREDARTLLAIAFSYQGLRKLTPAADHLPSEAFRLGLAQRSALLGDPTDATAEGNPLNWKVGGTGAELDCLAIVAGESNGQAPAYADELANRIRSVGVQVAYQENGKVLSGPLRGHEHFGFDDGVSQPGIRGRASDTPGDFITERHIDASEVPDAWLFGYPGQDLVWPGELVIGYPATSPDPLLPGPCRESFPGWARNGSFLVFRRLRQDVGRFWRTMKSVAEELSMQQGFTLSDEQLAARLVGRWPSGAPVNRVPMADDPNLGSDAMANNDFFFDSPTPVLKTKPSASKTYPSAQADPVGIVCPWAAHIRKVNTRDSASDMGASDSRYNRRLLRVGIPFGDQAKDRYADDTADPAAKNRGLLFLSIQSSIEQQFEFLMARWVNDPARPKMPGGHDMVIGQNAPISDHVRRCAIFGSGLQQAEIATDKQWVIPTGGGYFFVPSLSALRTVICL